MKLIRHVTLWSALVGFGWATTAFAQPEQWLQYHNGSDRQGYTWLDLSTNPPPNVALPKLNAGPYFARWVTPLDPTGGRWMCFDRSRKSGPCDRLFFDRNGNGRLDDEAAVSPTSREDYSATFDPLRLVFKGEDGPITYHLALRFMRYDAGDVRALAESAGWYEGTVLIGGKRRHLQLIDGNANGAFNDLATRPSGSDRIEFIAEKGKETETRFLGRLLELDGQTYQLEAARDGAFIKVKKAQNLVFGQVRVPPGISEVTAVGENGHFVRQPTNGAFSLPVGKYCFPFWSINRKDPKGVAWKLQGSSYADAPEFEVTATTPAALEVGEPVRASLQAAESKGTVAFGLRLLGRCGEVVEITREGQRPRAPQVMLTGRDDSYRATNTFEYG